MKENKEALKNKIIYRASYRGTKEMDILMTRFVESILDNLDINSLKSLDEFVNMDDETLISIKKNRYTDNLSNDKFLYIIEKFKKFNI